VERPDLVVGPGAVDVRRYREAQDHLFHLFLLQSTVRFSAPRETGGSLSRVFGYSTSVEVAS